MSHPSLPHSQLPEDERFEAALKDAEKIKKTYVDNRIDWYKSHTNRPRFFFRFSGITLILCSTILPAFATAPQFRHRDAIIDVLSIAIAVLSGLAAFFRWERTWKGNSNAHVAIEQFVAKWEIELTRATLYLYPEERIKHVCNATEDLLTNVKLVVAAESGAFFDGLRLPERTNASQDA